jgi:hypothetical protein
MNGNVTERLHWKDASTNERDEPLIQYLLLYIAFGSVG